LKDKERVVKWLSRVHDLELEIGLLETEKESCRESIKARGVPDPCIVGGRVSRISKPTEEAAVRMTCDRYTNRIKEIDRLIRNKEDEIEVIKVQTETIYYESDMKAEWYQAICYFYFEHMSLCEIAKKVGYEVSTVKTHKAKGIEILACSLCI